MANTRKGYEWKIEYRSYSQSWIPLTVLGTLTSRVKMIEHAIERYQEARASGGYLILMRTIGQPCDFRIKNMETGEIVPVESLEALFG